MDEVRNMTCKLIDEALANVEHSGWCQGEMFNDDNEICLMYARNWASLTLARIWRERGIAPHIMEQVYHGFNQAFFEVQPSAQSLPEYNDRDTTTYEDVVLTLKQMRELIATD